MLCYGERSRFLLCGQMLDFLHRLSRRIVSRESLLDENDWDALLGFEFTDAQLLSVSQFMEKTEVRTKTMRAAKGRINVEKEESKRPKTDMIASAVMGDMFNPQVNQGKAYVRYVCTELLEHTTFKSDLVVGLTCFDYSVLFMLPRGQAKGCYARPFQSFCVRGWLAKELKNCIWTIILNLSMTCIWYFRMNCTKDRRSKIWSHSCRQVQNCPEKNITCTFSNCVVCVWGILYQSCRLCHWVRLIEVVVQLIWQM